MLSWQFTLSASLNCTGQVIFVLLMLPYIIIVIMIIIMDFVYIAHVQIINKIIIKSRNMYISTALSQSWKAILKDGL